MTTLPPDLQNMIDAVGADRTSGATALVLSGIRLMKRAAGEPGSLRAAACELCSQQPSMAGFRTAAAVSLAADDPVSALNALAVRLQRTPSVVARLAVPIIRLRRPGRHSLRIVTCSRSRVVEETLKAVAAVEPTEVCCAESRPGREGVVLAESVAAAGAKVALYSDAAIGAALESADALVLGADAITGLHVINKVGSAALAALARTYGCAVTVLAGREKVLPPSVFATLSVRHGDPHEIAEVGVVDVRNPYFERISSGLIDLIVTEGGPVPPEQVAAASLWTEAALSIYESLKIR